MSPDETRTLVLRYIEAVWNRGELDALEDLTTPGFTYYLGGQPGRDRSGMGQFIAMTRAAFPDWRVQAEAIIGADDLVAVRWRGEVTHRGTFHGIPPTGRRITVNGINLYRVDGGKVVEEWEQTDSLDMLRQLGALPI